MKQSKNQSRRSWVVLGSLVGVLTLTSVLLRAMQGAPLTPDAASNLVSTDSRQALLAIFNTRAATAPQRWKSIFIHQSKTPRGNGLMVNAEGACGDHFVIGNGDGAVDGEIQFTALWDQQQPASPAPGQIQLEPDCVSICVIGDFDQVAPSPAQFKRLEQLVQTMQERLRIPADRVWLIDFPGSSAGIGRYFPTAAFQSQLLK